MNCLSVCIPWQPLFNSLARFCPRSGLPDYSKSLIKMNDQSPAKKNFSMFSFQGSMLIGLGSTDVVDFQYKQRKLFFLSPSNKSSYKINLINTLRAIKFLSLKACRRFEIRKPFKMLFKFRWYLSRPIMPNGTHINWSLVNKRDYDIRRKAIRRSLTNESWRRRSGGSARWQSDLRSDIMSDFVKLGALVLQPRDECDSNLNFKRWLFGDKPAVFYFSSPSFLAFPE